MAPAGNNNQGRTGGNEIQTLYIAAMWGRLPVHQTVVGMKRMLGEGKKRYDKGGREACLGVTISLSNQKWII